MLWLYLIFYLLTVILINESLKYFDTFEKDKLIILSSTLTISMFSILYFIGLNIHVLILPGLFLLLLSSILFYLKRKYHNPKPTTPIDYKAFSLFNIILILGFGTYKKAIYLDGKWDAWAFWNTHAKFLASNNWHELFNPHIDHVHSDYPLMLPATIAGFWKLLDSYTSFVPILFSFVIFYLLLWSLYSFINNRLLAIGTVIYLISNYLFYKEIFSQYADSLLALYYLISVAAFYYLKNKNDKLMFVTGFLVFSSMWVKNEGIAFAIIFSVVAYLSFFKNYQHKLKYFLYGGLLPIVITLSFKLLIATNNDITSSLNRTIVQVFDMNRLITILIFLLKTIYELFPIILVLIVFHIYKSGFKLKYKSGFGILLGTLSAYIFIYMVTPNNLNWHLSTSASRLIHQLLPMFLLLILNSLSATTQKNL